MPSARAIERLITYREVLGRSLASGVEIVSSKQLGKSAGCTADAVRNDLKLVEYCGTPGRGYEVRELLDSISALLDPSATEPVVLVGAGALGRAVLRYVAERRSRMSVRAIFDKAPAKVNRRIRGRYCYPIARLRPFVKKAEIQLGIITVPAKEAQGVADLLVDAGVKGLMNFAPVSLSVGPDVVVENMDIMVALAKLSYFVRNDAVSGRAPPEA
jgi:redox-sensing transcriptional repressor